VIVHGGALAPTLLESELFGHEKGAYTGAHERRIGRFEQANGGTLFLDEIGDLPSETQAKLLRVLQEKGIQRVGGDELIPVDVRILAATNRNLEAAILEREFREDLFFRLNVVTLRLPALAERVEDIPELVRYFIRRYAPELGVENPSTQAEAIALLQSQLWPGNVRELENTVRQSLLIARPFAVSVEHVRQALARTAKPSAAGLRSHAAYVADLLNRAGRGEVEHAYWRMIAELEPELFAQTMRLVDGNQSKAARLLGISRLKLREKLVELGLRQNR
jgi:DNA-binding NtrC family response regulator